MTTLKDQCCTSLRCIGDDLLYKQAQGLMSAGRVPQATIACACYLLLWPRVLSAIRLLEERVSMTFDVLA